MSKFFDGYGNRRIGCMLMTLVILFIMFIIIEFILNVVGIL